MLSEVVSWPLTASGALSVIVLVSSAGVDDVHILAVHHKLCLRGFPGEGL